MRPLQPTLKERKRYIVYEIITSSPIKGDVPGLLLDKLSELLGVFGVAKAGLLSIAYDKQHGIIRCAHDQQKEVRAALTMIRFLGRTRVIIRVLGVSGILAKSKRFLPHEIPRQHTRGVRR